MLSMIGDSQYVNADLQTTILQEIQSSAYTCLVCTDYITPSSKVWSCQHCYRVFDLDCIQDWASRGSSTQDDKSWRCPSCNHTQSNIPKKYTCWCGRSINPTLNVLEPHSCGKLCANPLDSCDHGCSLHCHPGPHSQKCTALGPVMKCYCGKHDKQLPCILTPYQNGWSCDEICGDILSCGIHKCQRKCHSGFCLECDESLSVNCYCGKSKDYIHCHERLPKISKNKDKKWIGNFVCDQECNEFLDCGIHKCGLGCHPSTKDSHKCANSPQNLNYCPCGKFKINDILKIPRVSCLDPIPTCDSICGKRLPCGHKCYWNCHEGECAPCYKTVDIDCRCGFTHFSVACGLKLEGYVPVCETKCNAKFNCKRHYCTERCCEFRQVAFDRTKLIKKQLRNNVITTRIADAVEFETVHTCTKECGQLLSCGKHRCKSTCHSGACGPCLESSSDDLVCNCGRTTLEAPVRCGTTLPLCPYQCSRPTTCGHRPEPHHCHEDDVSCPKCTQLVAKRCQCEKNNLVVNVMCYQDRVSCFKVCGKKLPCGEHECKKVCHLPGECQRKCTEKCFKIKECGHKCQQICHFGKPCNEKLPCQEHVTVTCDCGRRKQQLLCYTVKDMITKEYDLPKNENEQSQDITTKVNSADIVPHISCDEVCEKDRRNKLLFDALGLNPARTKDTEITLRMRSVESTYTPFIMNIFAKQPAWCKSIEEVFRQLLSHTVDSAFRSLSNSEIKQSHHFRPMRAIQRRFVKELADSWGLFAESHDPEPKRSVFVKLVKSSYVPDIDLEEAHEIYEKYKILEKKKALEKATQKRDMEENSSKVTKYRFWNGIVFNDVFFGITVETIDAAIYNIWNEPLLVDEESGEETEKKRKFYLVENGRVEFIRENMYVFYGDECKEEDMVEQEHQIRELCDLFDVRVKQKNMALKCVLAKVDIEEGIVLEIMNNNVEVEEDIQNFSNGTPTENLVDTLDNELADLKIEATTVSSEWW